MRPAGILTIAGVLGAGLLALFAIQLFPAGAPEAETPAGATLTEPSITFVNPAIGALTPKVTIVEFADFICSHCKELSSTLAVLLDAHPKDVRIIWKHMPNDAANPLATPAAVAAQCAADQGKFWEYHDVLFRSQSVLSTDMFRAAAQQVNLDIARFTTCFDAGETLPIVQRDLAEGIALGIDATPTLFVNGTRLVGAASLEDLTRYVTTAQADRR